MLESILIILVIVAVLLMILSFQWESLSLSSVTLVLWMVLSISVYNIEIPYQAIDSSDTIVTGVQTIESLYHLSWIFIGLSIIMMLYIVHLSFELWKGRKPRML